MAGWSSLTAFVLDQIFGYQTANKLKDRDDGLASPRPLYFGGSRGQQIVAVAGALTQNFHDWLDFELDGTQLAGFTVRARVEVRAADAAVSIQPKVRNITDDNDAVVGTAVTATNLDYEGTDQKQSLTFTPVAGLKTYRMQAVFSAAGEGWGIAYLEIVGT